MRKSTILLPPLVLAALLGLYWLARLIHEGPGYTSGWIGLVAMILVGASLSVTILQSRRREAPRGSGAGE